jgi:hypothetical protein
MVILLHDSTVYIFSNRSYFNCNKIILYSFFSHTFISRKIYTK